MKKIFHCCCDVMLLFIMQATTIFPFHLSAVNCNFRYNNFHYVCEDNINLEPWEMRCGGVDWVELAEDSDRWGEPGTAVINLRVPQNAGNFLTICKLVRSQEALCSME